MTDKELLELAAKAAGIKLTWWNQVPKNTTGADPCMNIYAFPIWNPLTDDGDALRLAVKLELDIDHVIGVVQVNRSHPRPKVDVDEEHGDDPYTATRRAIVRAAAEIGKSMG